jgi:hypothetical protein
MVVQRRQTAQRNVLALVWHALCELMRDSATLQQLLQVFAHQDDLKHLKEELWPLLQAPCKTYLGRELNNPSSFRSNKAKVLAAAIDFGTPLLRPGLPYRVSNDESRGLHLIANNGCTRSAQQLQDTYGVFGLIVKTGAASWERVAAADTSCVYSSDGGVAGQLIGPLSLLNTSDLHSRNECEDECEISVQSAELPSKAPALQSNQAQSTAAVHSSSVPASKAKRSLRSGGAVTAAAAAAAEAQWAAAQESRTKRMKLAGCVSALNVLQRPRESVHIADAEAYVLRAAVA